MTQACSTSGWSPWPMWLGFAGRQPGLIPRARRDPGGAAPGSRDCSLSRDLEETSRKQRALCQLPL